MLKTVTVTKEHWDRGNEAYNAEGDVCKTCVLAQAFLAAGFATVKVFAKHASLDGKEVELPETAVAVVNAFDSYPHRGVVPPFPITFDLEV